MKESGREGQKGEWREEGRKEGEGGGREKGGREEGKRREIKERMIQRTQRNGVM